MKPPSEGQGPGLGPTVRRASIAHPDETDATYVLSILEGPGAGNGFTLDASSPTRALVGTSPACTLRLADPQVSRRHASLAVTSTHVQLIDLDSTNGTTINGVVVKEASLYGGEVIRMGGSVLSLQRGQAKTPDFAVATSFLVGGASGRLIGESVAMRRLYPTLERLAQSNQPILIEGEAGTGKELLAEELHRARTLSTPGDAGFAVLEASAIPTDEIAGALFGAEGQPGLVEAARGGILFVDEIGDLPRHVQKRLRDLIVSQSRSAPSPNDVRLIAATRRDLDRDVTEGLFDDAFFFELAPGRVELPPLRDRRGDVALLARHFWKELAVGGTDGAHSNESLPADLLPRFEHYAWPGNVRELRSVVIQRATLGELSTTHLSDRATEQGFDLMTALIQEGVPFPTARQRMLAEFDRRYVEAVLDRHGGNAGAAARASGVGLRYFQMVRARVK